MNIERIRHTRIEKGMTQVQLAKAAGITQPTLSLIESGRARASFRVAVRLALALEISVDSLITEEAEAAGAAS